MSFDPATLSKLRSRARLSFGGNLSAAIAEAVDVLHRQAARDYVADSLMKGRPPLRDAERRAIDADLEEGWTLARHRPKRRA